MKINVTKKEQLESEIKKAQGRATARTIIAVEVERSVKTIEARLDELKVSKRDRKGMKFRVDRNAQRFPSAYKYMPESTIFEIECFASGWFVTKIQRGRCTNTKIIFVNEKEYQKYFKF